MDAITKTQDVNNNIRNNTSKATFSSNSEHVLNLKKDYASKTYFSNNYKSQVAYVENNSYKRSDNISYNNTDNISKHINQYTTDVVNRFKISEVSSIKRRIII